MREIEAPVRGLRSLPCVCMSFGVRPSFHVGEGSLLTGDQIVQTAKGTEKRKPLEEAKPLELQQRPKPRPLEDEPILALRSAALETTRLISFGYEFYAASTDAKNKYTHMPIMSWMTSILHHAKPDPALDPAIQALSMRNVAMYRRDAMLLAKSKERYTTALGALQNSLNSTESAMRDETLVVTTMMALYEVGSSAVRRRMGMVQLT